MNVGDVGVLWQAHGIYTGSLLLQFFILWKFLSIFDSDFFKGWCHIWYTDQSCRQTALQRVSLTDGLIQSLVERF